jgi:HlyD family secretion protein
MLRRILFLVVILGAIGAWIYYSQTRPRGEMVLTGIVTTDEVIVSSQVQGRLQELYIKQGDWVKKGERLATIEPEQWQADIAYYEQTQKTAATQVAVAEAVLRLQEEQISSQIAQSEANLAAAGAQVAQMQADLENARLTFQHEEEAYRRGAEARQLYDQARTAYDAQKARFESAQKQRDAAEAALNVAKANLRQLAVQRATIEVNKHQVEAAGAQKDKAAVQMGYTSITAPIDGIVDVRAARQGEVVNPAQAIVTLIDPDNLWVRVDIEESYIDGIHLGDKLPVRLPSGEVREGTVFYRAVDADYATQRDVSRTKRDIKTFEVRLRCDNKDRALAVGMSAYVTLPANDEPRRHDQTKTHEELTK